MTCPLTLVVMAAGLGRRYGSDTHHRLKQLEPVGPDGSTLLDYTVHDARLVGFERVVFVVREQIENDFHRACGARIARNVEVSYVHQTPDVGFLRPELVPAARDRPWGTGHAALAAAPEIEGPCSIVNADDFYGRESIATVAELLHNGSDRPDTHYLVAYQVRDTLSDEGPVSRGFCIVDEASALRNLIVTPGIERSGEGARYTDSEGRIVEVAGDALASMNLWGFMPSLFALLRAELDRFVARLPEERRLHAEFGLPSAVLRGVEDGLARVEVHRASNRWFGITHPGDLDRVRAGIKRLIDDGVYPQSLWS